MQTEDRVYEENPALYVNNYMRDMDKILEHILMIEIRNFIQTHSPKGIQSST